MFYIIMQMYIIVMSSLLNRKRETSSLSSRVFRGPDGRSPSPVGRLGIAFRTVLVVLVFASCGGDDRPANDAAVASDARVVTLDCATYCREIQANCTGASAQYADEVHCNATCASFAVGNSSVTDTSGDTLGCRILYAGAPSGMEAASYCAAAGPLGARPAATSPEFCSSGDVCASFCALEIRACGSLMSPLPGDPTGAGNNPLFQYQHMANCVDACAHFDKTHAYSTAAAGDSLACRLLQATRAVISVMPNGAQYCMYTGDAAKGPCVGTPTP